MVHLIRRSRHPTLIHAESLYSSLFFYTDPATTEIYTLSLHDALPISNKDTCSTMFIAALFRIAKSWKEPRCPSTEDRKSTRLNSSHLGISYAVFCLKKKRNTS